MSSHSHSRVRKGLYVMVSIFLFAMAAITGFTIYSNYKRTIETAQKQGRSYASALAEHASRTLGEADRVLDAVMDNVATAGGVSRFSERGLYDLFSMRMRHTPQIGSIFAVDADGKLIVSTSAYPAIKLDVTIHDHFKFHHDNKTGERFISRPYKNRLNGSWRFAMTRRINRADGSFAGYIGVALIEKYFDSFYSTLSPIPTQRISLVRSDGSYLVVAPFDEKAMKLNIGTQPLFGTYLKSSFSGAFHHPKDGSDLNDRIVSYNRLPGAYPVVAVVSFERQAVLAGWQRDSALIGVFTILFGMAVVTLSIVLSRRLRLLEYSETEGYAILKTAMDGFWITDMEGRLLNVNNAFCAMTGFSREELLSMKIMDIEADELTLETIEHIRKIRALGHDRFESRHRTRDGCIIDVEVSVNYLPMDGGRMFVFVRDITEIKSIQAALKENEETFRQIFYEAPDPILLIDETSCFVDCNQAAVRMLGAESREQVLMRHPSDLSPEMQPDGQLSAQKADMIIRTVFEKQNMHFEWLHKRLDGTEFYVDISLKLVSLHGQKMQLVHWRDITEWKQTENTLRKLSTAVEQNPAAIVITDNSGAIEYANSKFFQMTGYTPEEVLGKNSSFLKAGTQPQEFYNELWETIAAGREWQGEFHNRSKHGRLFWEMAYISPIKNTSGVITHFVAVKEDITERKLLQDQLSHMAHFDNLTGLPNRALFFDRTGQAVNFAKRENRRCGILFIDLDGFKAVNDTYGHETGDQLLRQVADIIRSSLRASDTVARMGGDEFTVILTTLAERSDAAHVAENILALLSKPIIIGTAECRIGASIGISIFPDDAEDAENLLHGADSAMYAVKRSGKNHYRFFDRPPVSS